MKQQDKIFMAVGGTTLAVAAGITGVYLFGKTDASSTPTPTAANDTVSSIPSTTTTTSTAASDTTASAGSTTSSGTYKDGTYTATASYGVPHGYSNGITAKVTVANGKVTDVTVTNDYTDRESGMYIDSFMSNIKSAVVGQSLDGLSVSRVGGATLTTNGFATALESVISQAKA